MDWWSNCHTQRSAHNTRHYRLYRETSRGSKLVSSISVDPFVRAQQRTVHVHRSAIRGTSGRLYKALELLAGALILTASPISTRAPIRNSAPNHKTRYERTWEHRGDRDPTALRVVIIFFIISNFLLWEKKTFSGNMLYKIAALFICKRVLTKCTNKIINKIKCLI